MILNQILISDKGADALSRAATISISTNDGSVNQRLRYYEDVLTHISQNPLLKLGIGNWKLSSIDYDKDDITGYIVPYHAHSDFIQLGAELGFLGFFLYLGIFLFAAYYYAIILFKSNLNIDNKWFVFLLITALGVYFVDIILISNCSSSGLGTLGIDYSFDNLLLQSIHLEKVLLQSKSLYFFSLT